MKKSVFILVLLLFVLAACSEPVKHNEPEPVEPNTDPVEELACIEKESDCEHDYITFEEYFGNWDSNVFYQDIYDSETYLLLDALIDHIDKNQIRLFIYGNVHYPSVTKFNEYLWNNKEADAFFKREDCVYVLITTYLYYLETDRMGEKEFVMSWLSFFDHVLTSELCMSKMDLTEKIQLMVLALIRYKYGFTMISTEGYNMTSTNYVVTNIMISIMLSSKYTPFMNDIKPLVSESAMGALYYMFPYDNLCLIPIYARQFINDNK